MSMIADSWTGQARESLKRAEKEEDPYFLVEEQTLSVLVDISDRLAQLVELLEKRTRPF